MKRDGELWGGHRDTEECQGTVMGRIHKVHGGAGGTMTEIRETQLEMQH